MKKFFLTLATWLFGAPIFMGIASAIFPSTTTQVDGKGVVIASGWAILIGFLISCYMTYRIFKRPKHHKGPPSDGADSKPKIVHDSYEEKLSIYSDDLPPIPKDRLSGFEKLFGPSSNTKFQWKEYLSQERSKNEESERHHVRQLVLDHKDALQINWQKSVTEDEYGTKDYTRWIGQIDRFFDSVNYSAELISREDALKIVTYEIEISTDVITHNTREATVDEKADQLRLMGLVEKHKNALIRNWHKAVEQDDYGSRNLHAWHEEVGKFLSSVSFAPKAISNDLASVLITAMVEDLVDGDEVESVFDFDEIMSAYDFEEKCAEELSRMGWSTKVTSGSGDQGIDVLAEKKLIRVVIQCKLYSKPVGNKAVQEAIAGKAYEKADYAAVVAPNGFTRSAKDLAERDNVFLLSPKDLKLLDKYINK